MKKTNKKFDTRNEVKKNLERSKKVHSWEIWQLWRCFEGMNVWHEISKDGKNLRVYLILNNDLWNDLLLVAPITTKIKKHLHNIYTLTIRDPETHNLKPCDIILNQIKLIDKKRLSHKLSQKKMPLWFIRKVIYMYHNLTKV